MQEEGITEEYLKADELEVKEKSNFKPKLEKFLESRYFVATLFVLISIISFSLGRVSKIKENREPVRVISEDRGEVKGVAVEASAGQMEATGGVVVASKNSTKYHYPWCAGAKQISEKNKITFASIEEARSLGYTPAANCKGLK